MNQQAIDTFVSANSYQFMSEGLFAALQTQEEWFQPQPSMNLLEEVVPLFTAKRNDVEAEFNRLVSEWKLGKSATSSSTAIAMHPAYQRIIGMGKSALPLIFRELGRELDHWFWALKAISGEDPVPIEHVGNMKRMTADWIQWATEKGYVR